MPLDSRPWAAAGPLDVAGGDAAVADKQDATGAAVLDDLDIEARRDRGAHAPGLAAPPARVAAPGSCLPVP